MAAGADAFPRAWEALPDLRCVSTGDVTFQRVPGTVDITPAIWLMSARKVQLEETGSGGRGAAGEVSRCGVCMQRVEDDLAETQVSEEAGVAPAVWVTLSQHCVGVGSGCEMVTRCFHHLVRQVFC